MLGTRGEAGGNPVVPGHCLGDERDGVGQRIVRLRAAQPQDPATRGAEAFPTRTGDAEPVIGSFQQIHRQAVRRDPVPVADRRDRREHIDRATRKQAVVRLVAEQGHVRPTNQVGEPAKIVLCCVPSGQVVRTVQDYRFRTLILVEEPTEVVEVWLGESPSR